MKVEDMKVGHLYYYCDPSAPYKASILFVFLGFKQHNVSDQDTILNALYRHRYEDYYEVQVQIMGIRRHDKPTVFISLSERYNNKIETLYIKKYSSALNAQIKPFMP
jgi:hypothetical protein